eukprot:CAMPEP_0184696336 /NCGR_PEP_ID=MMETSP0313-20130426/3670_1 /TAXON_ID=2792 /ORGANISM="Porphyridium aerugineum, Strain SAG 1380-2" /LENGTH=177 /DNA_ID=CAMNT_0027154947 /DNA_START=113 /DNA_END=643 /DNA_ORIENTATION=+
MPDGGGEVTVLIPITSKLDIIDLCDSGSIKRIRGVAYCCKVAPAFSSKMIDQARGILNDFTPDVYIYSDQASRATAGESPGFGLTVVAESTTHCLIGADACSSVDQKDPETCSQAAVYQLLEQIHGGGCVDASHQCIALLMMALSEPDISRIHTGMLTDSAVQLLRDLREFLGVVFK